MQDLVCRKNCVNFKVFWGYVMHMFSVARRDGYQPGIQSFTNCPWCGAELVIPPADQITWTGEGVA